MAEQITQVLGVVAMSPKGEYNPSTYYEKLNIVTYNGSSYCAKTSVQGISPANGDYWDLIASKGTKGDTGETGATPQKGVDYYTEAEKAEIEDEIENNLKPTISDDVQEEVIRQIGSISNGTPIPVNNISDMTDTTALYLLLTDGYVYYYDGTQWVQGWIYQATGVSKNDPVIVEIKNDCKSGDGLGEITEENILDGNFTAGGIDQDGNETSSSSYYRTGYFDVSDETTYYRLNKANNCFCVFYDKDMNIIPHSGIDVRLKLSADEDSFTTPKYAKKVRFSMNRVDITNQVVGRVQVSDFVPYETSGLSFEENKMYIDLKEQIGKAGIVDKSSELVTTAGYRVLRDNPYRLNEDANYSITNIEAKKGDLITLNVSSVMSTSILPITQKITTYYKKLVESGATSYEYLVPYDMDITVCTQNSKTPIIKWYHIDEWENILTGIYDTRVKFNYNKIMPMITAMTQQPSHRAIQYQRPLALLHFSDIHNHIGQLANIKYFLDKYGDYLDDALVTGDLCGSRYPDYVPIYSEEGYNKILLTIGNHDVYDKNGDAASHGTSYDDPLYWATNVDKYNQYFAPSISNWNVTQPQDASTLGLCYYYKDYTVGTDTNATVSVVRLIVLDAMAYDNTQHAWLSSVLTDAQTNGYTVVIADHFAPTMTNTDTQPFNCNFASLKRGMEIAYGTTNLTCQNGSATDLVDTFINGGGEFVCWLCGHYHYAMVGTLKSHPNQIFIAIEEASTNKTWADTPRNIYDDTEDLFNIVSIDTYYKLIKVARVGAEYDDHMRHRGTMVIDYANKTLLSSD